MKKTILILLISFSGCRGPQYKTVTQRHWSDTFQKCFCRDYDLNQPAPLEEFYDCGYDNCKDLIGFSLDEWAIEIMPKTKELKSFLIDECGVKE